MFHWWGWFGNWVKAEGVIIASREIARSGSGMTATYDYVVEVHPQNAAPFRVQVGEPFIATDFWGPREGQTVGVEIDLKTNTVRFDKSDPRTSTKAQLRKEKEADARRFAEKLKR